MDVVEILISIMMLMVLMLQHSRFISVDPLSLLVLGPDTEQCYGDFDCDTDVDGNDAHKFKVDFGRNLLNNPCQGSLTGGEVCISIRVEIILADN